MKIHRLAIWIYMFNTLCSPLTYGQDSIAESLPSVVVSAFKNEPIENTSIHVSSLSFESSENTSSYNVTDAVSKITGVTQFSTGNAISKPVIRGLYGNRILVLLSGMRFDNQQWQDEHGLGLTDIGLSRVEVIKGPLSILHGSEAVGGVLNLIPEQKAPSHERIVDAGVRYQSNTHGPLFQLGYKVNKGKWWYGARVGAESHSDYEDGNGNRVLNTRFNGIYGIAHIGFVRKNWLSETRYSFSQNRFGFIFNDLGQFLEPDKRWSRKMYGPNHSVRLHIVSSENTLKLPKSKLNINVGGQSNFRQEDEGGGKLSLQMQLLSALATVNWMKPLSRRTTLIVANNSSLENNTNYGARKLVPDAWMKESSLSGYLKHQLNTIVLEYGMGGGWRSIHTLLTPTVNTEENVINPFFQDRFFANGLVGISWNPSRIWNLKINSATGVRAPNLAELSSNGLHEGIYIYELGDPKLKNEQNWNTDFTITRNGQQIYVSVSGFYNSIHNYIYLKPSNAKWFGFPVSHYVQENAELTGAEATVNFRPTILKGADFSVSYEGLIGSLKSGQSLPYMPPQQIRPKASIQKSIKENLRGSTFIEMQIVTAQTRTASLESTTPSYKLINAGLSAHWQANSTSYELSIAANNLLNESYYDHMSRLKNYSILNMGRNIVLQLKIKLNNPLNIKLKGESVDQFNFKK